MMNLQDEQRNFEGKEPGKGAFATAGLVIGLLVGGIGGFALGANGASGPETASATSTATATAEAKPAPTETVTATPEPVIEEIVVAPQSCIEAIDHAETIIVGLSALGGVAAEYIDVIPMAYEAGYYGYGEDEVFAEMDRLTSLIEEMDMSGIRSDLDAATAECSAATGDGA